MAPELTWVAELSVVRIELDKSEQRSDSTRRPLIERQLAYAALGVDVLLGLRDRLQMHGRLF